MGSWLWTKIFKFQHKRYVILLIFKFLIECCNSWVSILSRSRDTVTKKWSCEPYTRLYIVELVAFDARGWPAITAKVASAIANRIAAFQRLHHRMKTLKCCNFWTVAAMNLIFSQNTFLWYPPGHNDAAIEAWSSADLGQLVYGYTPNKTYIQNKYLKLIIFKYNIDLQK